MVGLSVGLGLMSLEAGAFTTGQLNATDKVAAAFELVKKLGHATPQACLPTPMRFDKDHVHSGQFFKMVCPDKTLFLKYDSDSHADSFSPLLSTMENSLSPEMQAAILQPIAEFSFVIDKQHRPVHGATTGYYSVYPWVEGVTFRQLIYGMRQSGFDAERLKSLYGTIGGRLGALHRAGLVNGGEPWPQWRSRLVHTDLHYDNIMVTPGDEILIIDPDSFTPVSEPQPVLDSVVQELLVLLFVDDLALDSPDGDAPWSSAWSALQPAMAHSLLGSFCHALVGKGEGGEGDEGEGDEGEGEETACVSRLAGEMMAAAGDMQQAYIDDLAASGECSLQPTEDDTQLPVEREELERRLEPVLGWLR